MIKATMLFDYTSRLRRHAGWSETWYIDTTIQGAIPIVSNLAKKRGLLLPGSVVASGGRVTQLYNDQSSSGKSLSFQMNWPGVLANNSQDVPQMAALCSVQGQGVLNVKRFALRGLPDTSVSQGDLNDNDNIQSGFSQIANTLSIGPFRFRALDHGQPLIGIHDIANDGAFKLLADLNFNVGDYLTILKSHDILGKPVRGTFYVSNKTDARTGKFANWTGQTVGQSGSVRKRVFIYPLVDKPSFNLYRVTVRKVGRPFDVYHGRRSATR